MTKVRKQQQLPIDPASKRYPRNAKGEFGAFQEGSCFAPWQMEWHTLKHRHYSARLGIVELEDGTWLSDMFVYSDQHPTRDTALRTAVERVIDNTRYSAMPFINGRYTFPPRISLTEANTVIEWASGLIGAEPKFMTPNDLPKPPLKWADLPLFSGSISS